MFDYDKNTATNAFMSLFAVESNRYVTLYVDTNKEEKYKTEFWQTLTTRATRDAFAKHLKGIKRLALAPVTENGTCKFSALDVDYASVAALDAILEGVHKHELPICLFRSKSGNIHCFLFFKGSVCAAAANEFFDLFSVEIGLANRCDIATPSINRSILLPFFNTKTNEFFLLNKHGLPYEDLEECFHICRERAITEAQLSEYSKKIAESIQNS